MLPNVSTFCWRNIALLDVVATAETDGSTSNGVPENVHACAMFGVVVTYFAIHRYGHATGTRVSFGPLALRVGCVAGRGGYHRQVHCRGLHRAWSNSNNHADEVDESTQQMLLTEIDNLLSALSDALCSAAAAEQMTTVWGIAQALRGAVSLAPTQGSPQEITKAVFATAVRGLTRAAFGATTAQARPCAQSPLPSSRLACPSYEEILHHYDDRHIRALCHGISRITADSRRTAACLCHRSVSRSCLCFQTMTNRAVVTRQRLRH